MHMLKACLEHPVGFSLANEGLYFSPGLIGGSFPLMGSLVEGSLQYC